MQSRNREKKLVIQKITDNLWHTLLSNAKTTALKLSF